eukprot:scaffold334011_cov27-Prasinocladus_malaysianus.AAC.1
MSPLAVACEMLTGETAAAGQRLKTYIDLKRRCSNHVVVSCDTKASSCHTSTITLFSSMTA